MIKTITLLTELSSLAKEAKLNQGIIESKPILHTKHLKITLGCSKETDENNNIVYIYNVFANDTYININGNGTIDNRIPDDVIQNIETIISTLANDTKKNR